MRILSSVVYRLPFILGPFSWPQTNISSGSKKRGHVTSNLRLVIFLEDFDRNWTDSVIRDEVPALLDRLGQLQNVSFVLTVGTDQQFSEIMIRVCEHAESLT
jgi:hypothetical protein